MKNICQFFKVCYESLRRSPEYVTNHVIRISALFLMFVSFFVFETFWVDLINQYWVIPIMSQLKDFVWILVIPCLIMMGLYYSQMFRCVEEYSSQRFGFWLLYFTIYLICMASDNWSYFSWLDNCNCSIIGAYANVTLLPFFIETILWGRITLKNIKKIKTSPVLEIEHVIAVKDVFNRNPVIEETAKLLSSNFHNSGCYAVGISGTWGSGKTTFLNSLKDNILSINSRITIFEFSPWKYDSPEAVIKNFFTLFQHEMEKYFGSIASLLRTYVKELLGAQTILPYRIDIALSEVFNKDSSQSSYDKIKSLLAKTKHDTIILIDDLDRMDGEEIKEVLKLIRNTADFPYLQYIVTYDKRYIINTLEKVGLDNSEKYLNKIFNTEIVLPNFERRIIKEEVTKKIESIYKDIWDDNKIIEENIREGIEAVNTISLSEILVNYRDVIRFSNSLKFLLTYYKSLIEQKSIQFKYIYMLELIRFGWLDLYEILKYEPLEILGFNNKSIYLRDSFKEEVFEKGQFRGAQLPSKKIFVAKILKKLYSERNFFSSRMYKQYFMFRWDSRILSDFEFLSLNEYPIGEERIKEAEMLVKQKDADELRVVVRKFFSKILHENPDYNSFAKEYPMIYFLVESLLGSELLRPQIRQAICDELYNISFFDNTHFELTLDLINKLGKINESSERIIQDLLVSILKKQNLATIILDPSEQFDAPNIINNFLKNNKNYLDVTNGILNIIFPSSGTAVMENDLVLDYKKLKKIPLFYFAHYPNKLDNIGVQLFRKCFNDIQIAHGNNNWKGTLHPVALRLMKSYILKHKDEFLSKFIEVNPSTPGLTHTMLHPFVYYDSIFQGKDNFEKFLSSIPEDNQYIKRVLNFWTLYKYNKYQYVMINDQEVQNLLSTYDFSKEVEDLVNEEKSKDLI